MFAWGDESRHFVRKTSTSHYAVAVAVIDPAHVDAVRAGMYDLRPRGAKKNHFRDNSPRTNATVVSGLLDLPVTGIVVAHEGNGALRQERQRGVCLRRLLPALQASGVTQLTWESRGAADDRRDLAVVEGLRRSRHITRELRVEHVPGPADPILWLADTICGAFGQAMVHDNGLLWQQLEDAWSVLRWEVA